MRKSIFFCELRHLDRVREGEFDTVFAALKQFGIDGFQFSDKDIERAGEERLLAAMNRHAMRADVIHIVIPLLSKDNAIFRAACQKAKDTLALLHRLAEKYHLTGWARNTSAGVELELEGDCAHLDGFLRAL